MHGTASGFLISAFAALVLIVAVLCVFLVGWAARRCGLDAVREARRASTVIAALLALSAGLAALGLLADFSLPPKLPLFIFSTFALTVWLGASRYGDFLARSLPFWALVGINAFRLPLELLMHRAAEEGVMPVQMSYSGQNYDIATGALAIFVAVLCKFGQPPLRLVRIFNVVGVVFLFNVIVIAVLSMPLPIRRYMNEPANTWVAYWPFVWLPVFLVCLALLSHIVILRRLVLEMGSLKARAAPGAQ